MSRNEIEQDPPGMPEEQARVDRLINSLDWAISEKVTGDQFEIIRGEILKALREERALAWEEYADEVRDTWGRAYSVEIFPVQDLNEFDAHVRTVVSVSMGRHMAKRIEEQLRAHAAEARQSE